MNAGERTEFLEIRRALQATLTQGYDVHYPSLDSAVAAVIVNSETKKMRRELEQLAVCSAEVIKQVLEDHEVYLWKDVTPREFLVTLTTLCKLAD